MTPASNPILQFVRGRRSLTPPWRAVASSLLLAVALVLPYLFMHLGAPDGGDEPYQNLSIRHWSQCPLAILSFFQAHLWTLLFGDSFISIRYLGVLCHQLAIFMGCAYLYSSRRNLLEASFWFALCSLATIMGGRNIYNWDVGAIPYVALWLVATLSYIHHPSAPRALLAGALAALAALAHLTFVVYLPAALVVIAVKRPAKRLKNALAALLAFTFTAIFGLWLLLGNPLHFLSLLSPQYVITGHALANASQFLNTAIATLGQLSLAFVPSALCILLAYFISRLRRLTPSALCLAAAACILVGFLAVRELYTPVFFSRWYAGYGSFLFLFLLILLALHRSLSATPSRIPAFSLWLIGAASLLLGLGSDYFLERAVSLLCAMPIVMAVIHPYLWPGARTFLRSALLAIFLMLSASVATRLVYAVKYHTHSLSEFPQGPALRSVRDDYHTLHSWAPQQQWLSGLNTPWTSAGEDIRYLFLYHFADTHSPADLQQYHFRTDNPQSRLYFSNLLDNYGIILHFRINPSPSDWDITELARRGFRLHHHSRYLYVYVKDGIEVPPFLGHHPHD